MKNILIIEDDKALSNGVALALKSGETTIFQCFDIKTARQTIRSSLDLIILDVNLPDGSGLDLLQEIKRQFHIPSADAQSWKESYLQPHYHGHFH